MPEIVVIDAGHGGKDLGAVNPVYGVTEKEVNLAVATYMEAELKLYHPYIKTFMSRETDIFVGLKNRCIKANSIIQDGIAEPADLFLSIHTNAREVKGKYGIEIETYHCKGSEKGKRLAEAIQEALVSSENSIPTIDRGVKTAGFYVLRHTIMPAVLVELGFITDAEECIYLSSPRNQKIMGQVLADALSGFITEEA